MKVRVLTWNLFHGRDHPPGPGPVAEDPPVDPVAEGGWAWRLFGRPMVSRTHLRLNRDLSTEFAAFLAAAEWDVALLQEVPPRWAGSLPRACGAVGRRSLTARNWMRPFTFVPARLRPQLIGSWEGGSNLIMIRQERPGFKVVSHSSAVLSRRPERRVISIIRLESGLCLANVHAGTGRWAERDIEVAADFVAGEAGEDAVVFGGDFNLRPRSGGFFEDLERSHGFSGVTAPEAIDHLLTRGVASSEPAALWSPGRRDVPDSDSLRRIRLSDHAPVTKTIVL